MTDFVFEFDLGMVQESKRRVRRRAARLTLGTTTKRLLSDEEALALFQAIDSKQYSSFGLVKLSTLNLNELYRPPLRKLEKPSLRTWNPSGMNIKGGRPAREIGAHSSAEAHSKSDL